MSRENHTFDTLSMSYLLIFLRGHTQSVIDILLSYMQVDVNRKLETKMLSDFYCLPKASRVKSFILTIREKVLVILFMNYLLQKKYTEEKVETEINFIEYGRNRKYII